MARDFSTDSRNIRFIEADFISWPGEADYDAIAMIAVLHHLPFDTALSKARRLLRPGGVLLVVGLHREANPIHFIVRGAIGRSVSLFYHTVRRTAPVALLLGMEEGLGGSHDPPIEVGLDGDRRGRRRGRRRC